MAWPRQPPHLPGAPLRKTGQMSVPGASGGGETSVSRVRGASRKTYYSVNLYRMRARRTKPFA
eukprot:3564964-Prymnesium_polylepis.1